MRKHLLDFTQPPRWYKNGEMSFDESMVGFLFVPIHYISECLGMKWYEILITFGLNVLTKLLSSMYSIASNTCWKSRQNPTDGAKKPQGRLSPPIICLAAKNWTNQNRTEALFVEGAGDGFKTALALLVENGDPSMYCYVMDFLQWYYGKWCDKRHKREILVFS